MQAIVAIFGKLSIKWTLFHRKTAYHMRKLPLRRGVFVSSSGFYGMTGKSVDKV